MFVKGSQCCSMRHCVVCCRITESLVKDCKHQVKIILVMVDLWPEPRRLLSRCRGRQEIPMFTSVMSVMCVIRSNSPRCSVSVLTQFERSSLFNIAINHNRVCHKRSTVCEQFYLEVNIKMPDHKPWLIYMQIWRTCLLKRISMKSMKYQ